MPSPRRQITELTEKEHKVKSDLKDAEKNLSEWSAQLKVLAEKSGEFATQVS